MKDSLKKYFIKLLYDILITTIITFIIFIAIENFKNGIISNYFDMNLLLIIAAGCSLILIILLEKAETDKLIKQNFILFIIFVIILMTLLFMNLSLALILKVIITFVVFLSLIIYYLNQNNN